MRFLPLPVCALLLALPAKADKFWLSAPDAAQNQAAGSNPEVIEGVLIAEDNDGYHIRIVGGELILPRGSIRRIDKDGLTVDAIVKAEKEAAERLAAQNREREQLQQAQRQARQANVVEAAARRSQTPPPAAAPAAAPGAVVGGFDPVIGAVRGPDFQMQMLMDAQVAYDMTRDRRYLKLLRQLRRLR